MTVAIEKWHILTCITVTQNYFLKTQTGQYNDKADKTVQVHNCLQISSWLAVILRFSQREETIRTPVTVVELFLLSYWQISKKNSSFSSNTMTKTLVAYGVPRNCTFNYFTRNCFPLPRSSLQVLLTLPCKCGWCGTRTALLNKYEDTTDQGHHWPDPSCWLTRWQHFSAWNDLKATILWCIKNLTRLEEHSRQISSTSNVKRWNLSLLSMRQHICCGIYMLSSVRPSVCLVVRLSHRWISQKRLRLGSCNFHHRVAQSLLSLVFAV